LTDKSNPATIDEILKPFFNLRYRKFTPQLFMDFTATNCRSALRLKTHQVVWLVLLAALSIGLGSGVHAAGCAHRTENSSLGLDPFGNPLASNVLKIYSGGEFHYYVLPEGKPCNGPNCKGSPPANMSSVPQVIMSERCDLTFLTNSANVGRTHYRNPFVLWLTLQPTSPVLDGLLRPPTV
jgi:hypothetical protein